MGKSQILSDQLSATDTGTGTDNFFLRVLRAMSPSLPALTSCLFWWAGKECCVFLFELVEKPLSH
jgi:hypothetical protein